MPSYTLQEIQNFLEDVTIQGDSNCKIEGVGTLEGAQTTQIAFLENPKYKKFLKTTSASAVILSSKFLSDYSGNAIISKNPYFTYSKVATLFLNLPKIEIGIHPTAIVHPTADIHPTASIGPNCVIEANVKIAEHAIVGAACFIGENCEIGAASRLWPRVTFYYGVSIGKNCVIHSGAVLGSDGFGYARHEGNWFSIPQLGGVKLGDHVHVGSNTTIDRGALNDTTLENGVKVDNQIQIAHNVYIGENSAIAACVGIAGSTRIGKNCLIGGGVGISGHLEIADNVCISAFSGVGSSIREAGVYSGGMVVTHHNEWLRNVVRMKEIDAMAKRITQLEKQLTKVDES